MTWSNIIQKVDKEKRPWAKRAAEHVDYKDGFNQVKGRV